ncbi:hypothetical protein ACHAW5_010149 [Stephanodiscus triporus]|uniref:Phosphatidic acid phosphatase type 2/haloperoxidase domain-containing protein n=1 Tax=Stephanodiscus triporus TaxID=2934178 RepID=A0ABD3NRU5_9STRA
MTQPSQSWKPFSLTHVTYPVFASSSSRASESSSLPSHFLLTDVVPPLLALLSLAPPFGTCALAFSSLHHRDVVSAYVLFGVMIAVASTSILKGIIRQPRPPRYDDDYYHDRDLRHHHQVVMPRREHGMPSNHSCFVWFVATFVVLYVSRGGATWSARHLPSRSTTVATTAARHDATAGRNYHRLRAALSVSSSLFVATGCAYSRIYLGYHTAAQVFVGAIFGSSLGAAWHSLFETGAVRRFLTRLDGTLYDLEVARDAMLLVGDESGRYWGKHE